VDAHDDPEDDAMKSRPVLWFLVLAVTVGCAGLKAPPLPEGASLRSQLVYAYQQPSDVLDADWALCDLEADQWARYDDRTSQDAAWAVVGGFAPVPPLPLAAGLVGSVGTVGVVALNETALAKIPVVGRRRVREQLADLNDYYSKRAHRCLMGKGYPTLPAPPPVRRHDYSRCSATTLDEC
jgi:hypothetical protein